MSLELEVRWMRVVLTCLVFILMSGCNGTQNYSKENEVYEFVFLQVVGNAVDEIKIKNKTDSSYLAGKNVDEMVQVHGGLNSFPQDLLRDLFTEAEVSRPINWKPILVSGLLVSVTDETPIPSEGIYHVSGVSFNSEKDVGVFLIGFRCPVLCGAHDTLVHVAKIGKRWKVINSVRLWVS